MLSMSELKKTKVKVILIISVLAIVLVFGVVKVVVGYLNAKNSQIPDTNGDSKELCSIDDAFIESHTDWCDMIKHTLSWDDSNKSGVKGELADKDLCYSKDTMKSLSGVYVCNAYVASGDKVSYTIDSTVNSGNLRIVITDGYDKILHDIPIDTTHHIEIDTIKNQTYYVKLVGESANIEVTVTRNG